MGAHLDNVEVENGCRKYDDCFTCPYPNCIINGRDVLRTLKKEAEALVLSNKGYSTEQVAKRLKQRVRTVERWLSIKKRQIGV